MLPFAHRNSVYTTPLHEILPFPCSLVFFRSNVYFSFIFIFILTPSFRARLASERGICREGECSVVVVILGNSRTTLLFPPPHPREHEDKMGKGEECVLEKKAALARKQLQQGEGENGHEPDNVGPQLEEVER